MEKKEVVGEAKFLDALTENASVAAILKRNERVPGAFVEPDLLLRLRRFGSEGDSLVPLILDHTIGKNQSSFPALYNEGYYNPALSPYPELDVAYDEKKALVGGPTDRQGIQRIKKWYEESKMGKPTPLDLLKVSQDLNLKNEVLKGPASLPLRKDRIQSYLKRVDEHKNRADSALARLLLDETTQVPFPQLFDALQESAQKFLVSNADVLKRKDAEWYLWLPLKKWGSDQWLAALLLPSLTAVKWNGLADESFIPSPSSIVNFVIVDDAMYSGTHLMGTFDEYLESLKYKEKPKELHLHFIVPFSTCMGYVVLHDMEHYANNALQSSHSQNKPWLTVHIYSVFRLSSVSNLVECQHELLDQIHSTNDAEKIHFSTKKCPVISPFDPRACQSGFRRYIEEILKGDT